MPAYPPTFIERILDDKKQPSFEVARNLAQAFGMSDMLMFELAGLIPSLTDQASSLVQGHCVVIDYEPISG